MALGAWIRRSMGPLERPVANLYRALFVDITHLGLSIKDNSQAKTILEIGGGEGAMTEQLAAQFPNAQITSIDIAPTIGRLYRGDRSRVEFLQINIDEFAAQRSDTFDLIIICDVLHHIPWELHESILNTGKSLLSKGGNFIVKDWENRPTPINYLSYFLERYVTGDKVAYKTRTQLVQLIEKVFGKNSIRSEHRIRPWKNNILFFIKTDDIGD